MRFYLDINSWIGSVDDISHGSREANGAEGQHREGGDSIEPVEEGMHPLSCLLLLLHSALFCVGFLSFSSVLFSSFLHMHTQRERERERERERREKERD